MYGGEGDPMQHVRSFKMNFELQFRVNHNLIAKYFPTIFEGDANSTSHFLKILSFLISNLLPYSNHNLSTISLGQLQFKICMPQGKGLMRDSISSSQDSKRCGEWWKRNMLLSYL